MRRGVRSPQRWMLLVTILVAIGWVLACGLGLWALVEGLAAFERWIESDSRFQQ